MSLISARKPTTPAGFRPRTPYDPPGRFSNASGSRDPRSSAPQPAQRQVGGPSTGPQVSRIGGGAAGGRIEAQQPPTPEQRMQRTRAELPQQRPTPQPQAGGFGRSTQGLTAGQMAPAPTDARQFYQSQQMSPGGMYESRSDLLAGPPAQGYSFEQIEQIGRSTGAGTATVTALLSDPQLQAQFPGGIFISPEGHVRGIRSDGGVDWVGDLVDDRGAPGVIQAAYSRGGELQQQWGQAQEAQAQEADRRQRQVYMDELLNQQPIDVSGLIEADRQRRASEQALAMRAAMEMGASSRRSPASVQAQIAEMQQRAGVEGAASEAQIRMQGQMQNAQQRSAALAMAAQFAADDATRAQMIRESQRSAQQAFEYQQQLMRMEHDLQGQITPGSILGTVGSAVGMGGAALLGGPLFGG